MIRLATAYDIPAMKSIWDDGFHDPLNYIDFIFSEVSRASDAVVFEESGSVIAMLLMIPTRFVNKGEYTNALYILGAATLKKYRGRGIMSHLLEFAEQRAKSNGAEFSILVPGERYLFDFYKKRGYNADFGVRSVKLRTGILSSIDPLPDDAVKIDALTNEELFILRDSSLVDIPHIEWSAGQLRFVMKDSEIYGDHIAHYDGEAGRAYAVYNCQNGKLNVKELLGSSVNVQESLLREIVVKNDVSRAELRLPIRSKVLPHEGSTIRYGMAKPLGDKGFLHDIEPYMSLMLD